MARVDDCMACVSVVTEDGAYRSVSVLCTCMVPSPCQPGVTSTQLSVSININSTICTTSFDPLNSFLPFFVFFSALVLIISRLRLNSAHYTKMKELFRRARADRTATAGAAVRYADWTGEFHDCLFACLMRYEALQVGL